MRPAPRRRWGCGVRRCAWCRKLVDPTREALVPIRIQLSYGGEWLRYFHASGCYVSYREFVARHGVTGPWI